MAIESFLLGPAQVYVPQRSTTVVTGLSGIRCDISAVSPTDILNNSTSANLDTTATYSVAVCPLGGDTTVGGLTLAGGTGAIGTVSVTSGQGIRVSIASTGLPANTDKAYAYGVFLKKNSGNYKLVDYAYVDVDNGFEYLIMSDADSQISYPLATLTAITYSSTYPELGDRSAKGVVFTRYRTSGGVTVNRETEDVPINPDDGGNYTLPTARTASLQFSILQNTLKQVVLANAGKFGLFTGLNGHTITVGNMSMQTAVAQVTGNLPFKLVLPPDANKVREIRLYLAMISTNKTGASERWSRDAATLLTFNVSPTNIDPLLADVSNEVSYKYLV